MFKRIEMNQKMVTEDVHYELRLKCMLAKYFEFRKCFELQVSTSITILGGFEVEL